MTDRIEAIRARHEARKIPKYEDTAWLLAEVKEARDDATHFEAEYDDAVADLVRVAALATNWERLAATAMDPDVREWCTAAAKSVRAALAPVAPDAEPRRLTSACKCGDCYHPVIGPNTDGEPSDFCRDCACPSANHTRMTHTDSP
ncbi:MAG TPA: hypothetical protein VJL80_14545 [Aeromicrobium sp.]|nr:hypothetical protein [Aeromicrobium sp.]HKY59253.1 hypothetical protein [Aeromicrobium sp.]